MLPIRSLSGRPIPAIPLPDVLQIDAVDPIGGLPQLRGQLSVAPAAGLMLVLHIHNSAGIPIIEGRAQLSPGDHTVLFADLRPIGIDAYAHKTAAERAQIAARIWTRSVYGTVQMRPTAG